MTDKSAPMPAEHTEGKSSSTASRGRRLDSMYSRYSAATSANCSNLSTTRDKNAHMFTQYIPVGTDRQTLASRWTTSVCASAVLPGSTVHLRVHEHTNEHEQNPALCLFVRAAARQSPPVCLGSRLVHVQFTNPRTEHDTRTRSLNTHMRASSPCPALSAGTMRGESLPRQQAAHH